MESIGLLLIILKKTVGIYLLAWSLPAIFVGVVVSLGNLKHIMYMDRQLAKDLDKYYDKNGYMRPHYQLSWSIASRCFDYWIMYPFIHKRSTTNSKKFKAFMWGNALGAWSFITVFLFGILPRIFGIH